MLLPQTHILPLQIPEAHSVPLVQLDPSKPVDGALLGDALGSREGYSVLGEKLGSLLGAVVDSTVGYIVDGSYDGSRLDGLMEGVTVGSLDGKIDGMNVVGRKVAG